MNGNEFLDKMELVDPAYVEAADTAPKKKKGAWLRWGAIAACLCAAAIGGFVLSRPAKPQLADVTGLEMITIPKLPVDGMGFEGRLYYDIAERKDGNPWSESMKISTLPVYRNGSYDPTGAGVPKGMNEAEMTEKLNHITSALHLTVLSTEVKADGHTIEDGKMVPSSAPTEIYAQTDNGTISVWADGRVDYFLPEEGLALPDEYHFTYGATTEAEAEKVLSYLTETYAKLLNFAEPQFVSDKSYYFSGEFSRSYQVYDAAGDDIQDILNYNFNSVYFQPNSWGNLYLVSLSGGLLTAEKIGDYPIISPAQAMARLAAGHYQTSVPLRFPGKKWIGQAELIYRTGRLEEMLLPYYRFHVLLPDECMDNGLKNYGAYYVPAIAEEYIANMPIYDGRFD